MRPAPHTDADLLSTGSMNHAQGSGEEVPESKDIREADRSLLFQGTKAPAQRAGARQA